MTFRFCGETTLGINVRGFGRFLFFERWVTTPSCLLDGSIFALSVLNGRRSRLAALLRGAKWGGGSGVIVITRFGPMGGDFGGEVKITSTAVTSPLRGLFGRYICVCTSGSE